MTLRHESPWCVRILTKAVLAGGVLLLMALVAPAARAGTITVTTMASGTGVAGDCTLQEAIQAANTDTAVDACLAGSGADTIIIGNCNITLLGPFQTDPTDGPIGLPDITTDILILGIDPTVSIIERSAAAADFAIFRVLTGGTLSFENVTVQNGRAASGGAVINRGGTLNITTSTIQNNQATGASGGGAIANLSPGALTISSSFFGNNMALSGPGGGIRNESTLDITSSTFVANTAATIGGAFDTFVGGAPVTVSDSFFFGNQAGFFGGAIHHHVSPLTISNSNFFSNNAGLGNNTSNGGGAIEGFGDWTITDSYFDGNVATSLGNPSDGGALRYIGNNLMISGSAFSNNSASSRGGAIELNGGGAPLVDYTIVNSTISGNSTSNDSGAGINLRTGSLDVNNLTITENFAEVQGGGIYATSGTTVTMRNTILAGNPASGFDCFTEVSATFTSQGRNLIGNNSNCTITGPGTGDIIGTGAAPVDPMLGTLQTTAGLTPTHPLRPGSPAIDAGDPGTPGSGGTACEATDQRGVARPDGLACDMGAHEGVLPMADLSITKADMPDPVTFGSNVTYTITVTNAGPDTASGVGVVDTMPNDTGFVSATPSQGMCPPPLGDQLFCDLGDILSGNMATVTLVFNANQAGTITNSAFVFFTGEDPDFLNNDVSETTTVLRDGDLKLTKDASAPQVFLNTNFDYTITVENLGSTTVNNFTVTDTLPAGVTFVSATAGCSESGGVVTCDIASLAGQATTTLTITVTAPGTVGFITNSATVNAAGDPDSTNDTDTEQTLVRGNPFLTVTKTDSPDPVAAGANLTYTISVVNESSDPATGVVVQDSAPIGSTFVSISSTQGSCTDDGLTGTCDIGTVGGNGSFMVTFVVRADFPCILNNTAFVTSNEDPVGTTATQSTTVGPATPSATADLTITKTDSPDPVDAGLDLTYTVMVSNGGPDDATNVVLTDTLPAGASFVSATPSQGTCSQASGTVTCNLGTLAVSASATITIVVQSTAAGGSPISNTASVTSDATDPNPSDNSATASTTVNLPTLLGPSPYLSVNDSPFLAGIQAGTVALETFEDGRFDVPGVMVSGGSPIAPSGITDSVDGDDGAIDGFGTAGNSFFFGSGSTGITFTFSAAALGQLPTQVGIVWTDGGGTTTFEAFDAAGASLGIVGPAAIADGSINGTTAEDNFFGVTHSGGISAIRISNSAGGIEVDHLQYGPVPMAVNADLTITKMAAPSPVDAGADVTYTIVVTNSGVGTASGVMLTDVLPAGTSFISATPSQGTCMGTATVTCDLGALGTAAQATVTIVATVTAATGTIDNTASVTSGSNELFVFNNSALASVAVNAMADLSVSKADSPDPVAATDNLTYTVTVRNNGPSPATGVMLSDALPASATFTSATPSQGTCTPSPGGVACNLGSLGVNASATVTIVVVPTATGMITNTASVSANEPDPNTSDNTVAEDTTVVAASADLQLTKADSPDPVIINQNLTYTLTVRNNGPQAAQNVVLTDTLPSGPTFISATAPCTQAGGIVNCDLGTIASGAQTVITIVVQPLAAGSLTNLANANSTTSDPNTANNSASATTTVSSIPFTASFPQGQPGTATVNSGGTVTVTVTITPNQPGITVTVACGPPLPPDTTCTAQPSSLMFPNLNPQTVTITIQTTECILAGRTVPRGPQFPMGDIRLMWPMLFVLSLLLWVGLARRDEQLKRLTPVVVLLLFVVLMGGCATAGGPVRNVQFPIGTLPGTYTVPMTFTSSGQSQTLNFILNVNL